MNNVFGLLDFEWDKPLSEEDQDHILEKIIAVIHKWRMEVPAMLFLEASAPLSPLAGQGLIAFSPFVAPLMPSGLQDVQRLHKLLARPENIRRLIDLLSEGVEERTMKEPNAARE